MTEFRSAQPSASGPDHIFYLFLDGVGLGPEDPETNPFTRYASSFLSAAGGKNPATALPADWQICPTDAHMGLDGLPQSATGQTALWTGADGPRLMGRHMTGFPGPTLKRVIQEYSIVKQFVDHNRRATLLNAYSDVYLRRIEKKPRLMSASTHVQKASGQPLKTLEDLEARDAIYMDITHEIMHRFFPVLADRFPILPAEERGRDLVRIGRNYHLVLHEFFITDKAGHDQSWEMAEWAIHTLEAFIGGIVAGMRPQNELLIITSDHGNMEDLSTKTHTNNKVPTFLYGCGSEQLSNEIRTLMDIPRALYRLVGIDVDFDRLTELYDNEYSAEYQSRTEASDRP